MQRGLSVALVLCGALGGVTAASASNPPSVIELDGDYLVEGRAEGKTKSKAKGNDITLKVDPSSPNRPVINPEYIQEIGLKKNSMIGFRTYVGPVVIDARTAMVSYQFGDLKKKRRSILPSEPYVEGADGGVGPGGLPHDIVKFNLRPVVAGESKFELPLHKTSTFNDGNSVTKVMINGKELVISFHLGRSNTLATAAAGKLLAAVNGGQYSGETSEQALSFGIARPVREMTLGQPLDILRRPIDKISVRTLDFGDATTLPEKAESGRDNDEIIVTAQSGKKDKNRYALVLGLDDLSHCSSITFDKPAKLIRFSCVAG